MTVIGRPSPAWAAAFRGEARPEPACCSMGTPGCVKLTSRKHDTCWLKYSVGGFRCVKAGVPGSPSAGPEAPSKEPLLNFDYGMELTYHGTEAQIAKLGNAKFERLFGHKPGGKQPVEGDVTDMLRRWCKQQRLSQRGDPDLNVEDTDTAEFNSPVLRKMSEIKLFYDHVAGIARKMEWPVTHPDTTSGGGHLHLSKRNGRRQHESWTQDERQSLMGAASRYYWLSWLFNDPEDNDQACWPSPWMVYKRKFAKKWSINAQEDTVELRFFEAPHDWHEQKLHIEFADAFVAWASKKTFDGYWSEVIYHENIVDLRKLTYSGIWNDIDDLFTKLRLNPRLYERFFERNLKKRLELGWRYRT